MWSWFSPASFYAGIKSPRSPRRESWEWKRKREKGNKKISSRRISNKSYNRISGKRIKPNSSRDLGLIHTHTHTYVNRSIYSVPLYPSAVDTGKNWTENFSSSPDSYPFKLRHISIGKTKFPGEKKRKSPIIEDVNLHPSTYTADISISLDNATHSKWNEQTISELCDDSNLIF